MQPYFSAWRGLLPVVAGIFSTWLVLSPITLQAETAPRKLSLSLGDFRFHPAEISIRASETVQLELSNKDRLTPHNFTLRSTEAGLDINLDVGPGKTRTVEITPLVPGNYTYFCNKKLPLMKSHRERGMRGTLVVTPAAR